MARSVLFESKMKKVGVMEVSSMVSIMSKLVRELDEVYEDLSWKEQQDFDKLEETYNMLKRKNQMVNLSL